MDYGKICINCMKAEIAHGGRCPVCGFSFALYSPDPIVLEPYTILGGRYLIGRELGSGGFGITYLAFDLVLERIIAIKEFFMQGRMARETGAAVSMIPGSPEEIRMVKINLDKFRKEAKTLASLDQMPGIVTAYDYFHENNTAYIVMEYLEGVTLKDYVQNKGGRLPASEVTEKLRPVLRSLQMLHERQILHRDISPDNIMVQKKGGLKLFDFGGAKEQFDTNKDLSVMIFRKTGYSPVEQYGSGGQGAWTDIYAMAATMYFCITGEVPVASVKRVGAKDPLLSPRQKGVHISESLNRALMKGLAVKPAARYQSMQEFRAAVYGSSESKVPLQEEAEPDTYSPPDYPGEKPEPVSGSRNSRAFAAGQSGGSFTGGRNESSFTGSQGDVSGSGWSKERDPAGNRDAASGGGGHTSGEHFSKNRSSSEEALRSGNDAPSGQGGISHRENAVHSGDVFSSNSSAGDSAHEGGIALWPALLAGAAGLCVLLIVLFTENPVRTVLRSVASTVLSGRRDSEDNEGGADWIVVDETDEAEAGAAQPGETAQPEAKREDGQETAVSAQSANAESPASPEGQADGEEEKTDTRASETIVDREVFAETEKETETETEVSSAETEQPAAESSLQESEKPQTDPEEQSRQEHRYELLRGKVTWQEAFDDCIRRGGHLVRFENEEEYLRVLELIQAEPDPGKTRYYIGARRDPDSRLYFWVNENNELIDEGVPLNFNNEWNEKYWLKTVVNGKEVIEPSFNDAVTGDEETVLELLSQSDGDGIRWTWNDVGEDIRALETTVAIGYICEYE